MKPLSALAGDFERRSVEVKQLMQNMPRIAGVECVKVIKANFRQEGYTGPKQWKPRSKVTEKIYSYNRTKEYRTPKRGEKSKYRNPLKGSVYNIKAKILQQTGNLRDSVRSVPSGRGVLIGVFGRPVIGADGKPVNVLSYTKIHNEGGKFLMFGKTQKQMPRRQFMPRPKEGPNATMKIAIRKKYDERMAKIFNTWK